MPATSKTFDCVQMKKEIQAKLLAEFDQRDDQAVSFLEFVEAKSQRSAWVKSIREKYRACQASSE